MLSGAVQVVSEADWPNNPGAFTLGDGATTIRIPDGRGLIEKGYHDGSGSFTTDTIRGLGSYEADENKIHQHPNGVTVYPNFDGGGPFGTVNTGVATTPHAGSSGSTSFVGLTGFQGSSESTVRNAAYLPIIRAY